LGAGDCLICESMGVPVHPLDLGKFRACVCLRCDAPGFRILVARRLDSWFRVAGTSRFCSESSIRTGILWLLGFCLLTRTGRECGIRLHSDRAGFLGGMRGFLLIWGFSFSSFRESSLSFTGHTSVSCSVEFRVLSAPFSSQNFSYGIRHIESFDTCI